MPSPLFDINADGSDQGYVATLSEALAFKLRSPSVGISKVLFQVFSAAGFDPSQPDFAKNPPRASDGAPELTLDNGAGSTGQSVQAATPASEVTSAAPASGAHSYIVRCVLNGGKSIGPKGQLIDDPSLIHERMIAVPNVGGVRKIVATERTQFSDDGWAEPFNALVDSPGGGGGGDFFGPAGGVVDGELVAFSGTSGKAGKGSGLIFAAGVLAGLSGTPTLGTHAATKAYVDSSIAAQGLPQVMAIANNTGPADLDVDAGQVVDFQGDLHAQRQGIDILVATAANTILRDPNDDNWIVAGTTHHSEFFGADETSRYDASQYRLSWDGTIFAEMDATGFLLNAHVGELTLQRQGSTRFVTAGNNTTIGVPAAGTIFVQHNAQDVFRASSSQTVVGFGGNNVFTANSSLTALLFGGTTFLTRDADLLLEAATGDLTVNAQTGDVFVYRAGSATSGMQVTSSLAALSHPTSSRLIVGSNDVRVTSAAEFQLTGVTLVKWFRGTSNPSIVHDDSITANDTGDTLTMRAQGVNASGTLVTGGNLRLFGGNANTGTATERDGGHVLIGGGLGGGTGGRGNIALATQSAPNWQGMHGGMFIANVTTSPTGDPTGGGYLYSDSGVLSWHGGLRVVGAGDLTGPIVRATENNGAEQLASWSVWDQTDSTEWFRIGADGEDFYIGNPSGVPYLFINGGNDVTVGVGALRFDVSVSTPFVGQGANSAGGGITGQKLTLRAQNCTGASSTGGSIDVGPGSGSSQGGKGRLISGDNSEIFAWDDTGSSWYGASTVAKQTITGARDNPESALANLLSALATWGPFNNSTTAS